ncbi:MFS transporter, partial [Akkermansia muciniphila]|uniref:MFS transporter n=1 Tax=Akkermansia muciniphila TaxID=239935 RepID=UPI00122EF765
VLGVSKGTASMTLTFFSLALVIGAIPAGIIGTKIGRKKTIIIGLIGMLILFSFTALSTDIVVVRILLTFAGLSWALININSLPMVVEIAKSSRVGKYTGYYYFFSGAAAIISPPLFGLIRDITNNYAHVFIYSAVAFVCAFICILTVKHGVADYSEEEIQAEVKKLED